MVYIKTNVNHRIPVVDLQMLFVCCIKTVQFNKFVTSTQRDGDSAIQDSQVFDYPLGLPCGLIATMPCHP